MKLALMINILNYHHINFEFLVSMQLIDFHIMHMYYLLKKKMILIEMNLMMMFLKKIDDRLVVYNLNKINTIF